MVNNRLPCLTQKIFIFFVFFMLFTNTLLFSQERVPGELFPPDKIFLLEEPRDWQDTEKIIERLHLQAGDIVADIGAGSGFFTVPLALEVGEQGMVFAEDIQIEMINFISNKVEALGLKNVRVVFGKAEDPSLLDNYFNLVFLANTYHELEKPFLMLENIRKALRYYGRLAIIDWDRQKKLLSAHRYIRKYLKIP